MFQIALHRNIAAASNANQDQPLTQERQHRHKIYITTIAIVYLTIVLSLSGLDGIRISLFPNVRDDISDSGESSIPLTNHRCFAPKSKISLQVSVCTFLAAFSEGAYSKL